MQSSRVKSDPPHQKFAAGRATRLKIRQLERKVDELNYHADLKAMLDETEYYRRKTEEMKTQASELQAKLARMMNYGLSTPDTPEVAEEAYVELSSISLEPSATVEELLDGLCSMATEASAIIDDEGAPLVPAILRRDPCSILKTEPRTPLSSTVRARASSTSERRVRFQLPPSISKQKPDWLHIKEDGSPFDLMRDSSPLSSPLTSRNR